MKALGAIRYNRWNPFRRYNKLVDEAGHRESISGQIDVQKARFGVMRTLITRARNVIQPVAPNPTASFDVFAAAAELSPADIKVVAARHVKTRNTYWVVAVVMIIAAMLFAFAGHLLQFATLMPLAAVAGVSGMRYELEAWRFRNRRFGTIHDYLQD